MSERKAYLAVTAGGWAFGPTEGEAVANARDASPGCGSRCYQVYEVDPDTEVDEQGRVVYPAGRPPVLVREVYS